MFQANQREIYVGGVRYDDLLAKAARARLVAAATENAPSDRWRAAGRIRVGVLQVVSSLASFVATF